MWNGLLDDVVAQVMDGALPSRTPSAIAARAHTRLLVALDPSTRATNDLAAELIADAVAVMLTVAHQTTNAAASPAESRATLTAQLRRRLGAHEQGALAGEVTYHLSAEETAEPASRIRQARIRRARHTPPAMVDAIALRVAAVELAALLIRAAANLTVTDRAETASEERPSGLPATLRALADQLAARAADNERAAGNNGDLVACQLAGALRLHVSHETVQALTHASEPDRLDAAELAAVREVWMHVAVCEHRAVAGLDEQLRTPTYSDRFGDLPTAIVEGAINVLCGARLISRPGAFRHHAAWGHQAVALTYALERYVAGLRGHAPSLRQAQLITLTRLVRATAAIALLDLRTHTPATNGRPTR